MNLFLCNKFILIFYVSPVHSSIKMYFRYNFRFPVILSAQFSTSLNMLFQILRFVCQMRGEVVINGSLEGGDIDLVHLE
jgi:hypothetical protein